MQAKLIIDKINIINKTNKQIFPLSMCCSIIKSKKSKNHGKPCGRHGKIVINNRYYCGLHMKKKRITFIDLFSGIGSFHWALKKIDHIKADCVLASDIDPNCNATYHTNFGIKPASTILDLKTKQIPNADILLAGFPCQTFSLIGKKEGLTESVTSIFDKLLHILEKKKINSFVFENVKNLITMNKGAVFNKMISSFEKLNYKIYWKVLNCKSYGIPQSRNRVFIVGLHKDRYANIDYEFPEPLLLNPSLSTFLGKKFKREFAFTIRCGGRSSAITSSFNWSRYFLEDDSIYTLSIDDCKKLQNFPPSFRIEGNITSKWKQLGNTIPTNLAFHVLKKLIDII